MVNVDTDSDKELYKNIEETINNIAPEILETNKLVQERREKLKEIREKEIGRAHV